MTEDKINTILDAAYHLFGTKGFYETKISEIADKAGIAKGTVYLYFSSKEELFIAMTERDFTRFFKGLENKLTGLDSFELKLERIAQHYLEYFYNCREFTKIFFQAPNNDPKLWETMKKNLTIYFTIVTEIMSKHQLTDPDLKAKAFNGLLEGFKMDILFSPHVSQQDIKERTDFIVIFFLKGCYG